MRPRLLLVTGPGRSGTSTAAGILHHLGAHVPGPHLAANSSNPKGFFESTWSVDFHHRLLRRAHVGIRDARPDALADVRRALRPRERAELGEWIAEITHGHDLTVVKDPRISWTTGLFAEIADGRGIETEFVVMLRRPAEVVGSRASHYGSSADDPIAFGVNNLAGWIATVLRTERETRGLRRAFVGFDDLLTAWRGAVSAAASQLGHEPLDLADRHAVDEFVDPELGARRVEWSDLDLPTPLTAVADRVWAAASRLADGEQEARSALDGCADEYAAIYADARRLVQDDVAAAASRARRAARRDAGTEPGAPSASGPSWARRMAGVGRRLRRTRR